MSGRPQEEAAAVDESLTYYLPETVLRVLAQATRRLDLTTGERERVTTTYSVVVETRADVSDPCLLPLAHEWLSDREVTVQLTEDGRLTGGGATSTGAGGRIVSGVATLAGQLLGATRGFRPRATAEHSAPATYADEHPELVARAEQVRAARDAIDAGLLAALKPPGPVPPVATLDAMGRAGALLDALAGRLALHRSAWEADAQDETHAEVEVVLALEAIPRLAGPLDPVAARGGDAGQPPAVTQDQPAAQALARDFGIHLALHDPQRPAARPSYPPEEASLTYRRPRPVTLLVWTTAAGTAPGVDAVRELAIVDGHSEQRRVPLGHSIFGKRAGSYSFSESGALTGLTTSATSGLAAVTDTLSGLPASLTAGLSAEGALEKALGALRPDAAAGRLAATVAEQKQLEATIARDTALATADQAAELARLRQQAELLRLRAGRA